MLKTTKQELLEARHGKGIEEIIREALERHRGEDYIVRGAAVDLGVSNATLYFWLREMRINPDEYRLKAS